MEVAAEELLSLATVVAAQGFVAIESYVSTLTFPVVSLVCWAELKWSEAAGDDGLIPCYSGAWQRWLRRWWVWRWLRCFSSWSFKVPRSWHRPKAVGALPSDSAGSACRLWQHYPSGLLHSGSTGTPSLLRFYQHPVSRTDRELSRFLVMPGPKVLHPHSSKSRHFFDTYSPVARFTTIRVLLSRAASHGLLVHQMGRRLSLMGSWMRKFTWSSQIKSTRAFA